MKQWITVTASIVIAIIAYPGLFFITAPLIVLFNVFLNLTPIIAIILPGVVYFLIAYAYFWRDYILNWFKKNFRKTTKVFV